MDTSNRLEAILLATLERPAKSVNGTAFRDTLVALGRGQLVGPVRRPGGKNRG
jgi:hypothetical protein